MESERRVIEFEMMRLDKMIQKGECNSSAEDTNAKREKQSKKKCMIHLEYFIHSLRISPKKTYQILASRRDFNGLFHHSLVKMLNISHQVVNERSETQLETQNKSSTSGNDTRSKGADIKFSNDTESMNEVQSTATYNVFANEKQHAKQPKFIHEGGVDQDAKQRLDKQLKMIIQLTTTNESLNQTLKSENDCLKKTIAKLQKDFSKLEA
ncbi:hypothetical protein Tco_1354407 [Tanacetum coccineum]